MFKTKLFIAILLLSGSLSFSQDTQYFDAPFGGGGGYTPGWIIPEFNVLNEKLSTLGIPEFSSSGLYTSGGAGFLYIGFIRNLRLGGMGFGGSSSSSSNVSGVNREAIYSVGGGGLTIEYTLPFIKNVGVSIGTIVGGGSVSVEFYSNNGNFNWNDLGTDLSSSSNVSRTLTNNFWIVAPTINIDIPFYRFFSFRVGGGYVFTAGEEWRAENDQKISNVPTGLNGKSFFIQTGVFLGFFSF